MSRPLYLGIEIGGTKLQLALGHGDGSLLAVERRRIVPDRGAEGIRLQILEAFGQLRDRHGLPAGAVAVVGVGFGGPVDRGRGTTTRSYQVEGWTDFPLAAWVRDRLGVARVLIENDADLAALGEARHGAGVGFNPVLYLTIGSGIGGGLVVDGLIYRGSGLGAVEIGHLVVEEGLSGEPGLTVEDLASGWSIARRAREQLRATPDPTRARPPDLLLQSCHGDLGLIDAPLVARCEREGDLLCQSVMTTARRAIARGLASAITLIAPRRIILGGGVSLLDDPSWFEPIRRDVDRRVFPDFRGTFDIVRAQLGEEVVLHGAMALASNVA